MAWAILLSVRGFLAKVPWQVWFVIAVLLSAWLWGNHRYSQGVHDERARWEAAAAKARARADKATVTAGEKRAADTIENYEADRARKEAIANAPDDQTGAASTALACERLSRAGLHTAATRARCGSGD